MDCIAYLKLKEILIKHESWEEIPYTCPAGYLSWGVGRNLDTVGFRESEKPLVYKLIELMLSNDMEEKEAYLLRNFEWFDELSSIRQVALIDMVFCVGQSKFKKFKRMINALRYHDYPEAAVELLDSKFARQTGNRAIELASMIKEDKWP